MDGIVDIILMAPPDGVTQFKLVDGTIIDASDYFEKIIMQKLRDRADADYIEEMIDKKLAEFEFRMKNILTS